MRPRRLALFSAILLISFAGSAVVSAAAPAATRAVTKRPANSAALPLDQPRPLPGPRPSAAAIKAWQNRRFGMFIHFGLYSTLGGIWQGKKIDNGYSEQIMANAPIPLEEYAALAAGFNPTKFDPDAIVALAKDAGMKYIVITSKHHDGFNMFGTRQTPYNVVDATPYHKDVVKLLSEACARGGIGFGVYYSSIDWHQPGASIYEPRNSNPIPPAHEEFNVRQLKELLANYGPITEVWFDMGAPTPAQSARFTSAVHDLQPNTMVSGRVFNSQGDFNVMNDNGVPSFVIDEPWQTPASIFSETWGYRSWQERKNLAGKIQENILRLVQVASRGGNFILNIGPEGDGSVVPYEADVLRGIGQWMKRNGDAIYGTGAQPFRNLAFGYATVGKGNLYLFVKNPPKDGILHLPALPGVTLKDGRILGNPAGKPVKVSQSSSGISIALGSMPAGQASSDPADFLPVIAVPYQGRLHPQSPVTAPGPDGSFALRPADADHFYNYNGGDYWADPTLYKLRWAISAKPGRYKLRLRYSHGQAPSKISVFINGIPATLQLDASPAASQNASSTYSRTFGIAKPFSDPARGLTEIELTPPAPFYKGDRLPVQLDALELVPE